MSRFFGRITRYSTSTVSNPREDRLTEITAVVMQHVPELPSTFARLLLGDQLPAWVQSDKCSVSIETQVPVHGDTRSGFVDLVLEFTETGSERPRSFITYIENKHGSDLSGDDQLDVYLQSMRRLGKSDRGMLVVLAPASFGSSAADSNRNPVQLVYWEAVASALRVFARTHRTIENSWLLEEFLEYLQQEDLMPAKPLDVESLMYMALYVEASKSVNDLHRLALEQIAEEWGQPGGGGFVLKNVGPGTYHHFDPGLIDGHTWSTDGWFEFSLRPDNRRLGDREVLAFFSGATWTRRAELPPQDWFDSMKTLGFEQFEMDGYLRCMRIKSPADLLTVSTLHEQGAVVGDWCNETFSILKSSPPVAR